jgi:hypothetical protein
MVLTLILVLGLLLLPFCAWNVASPWPAEIRNRMLLIVAWGAAACAIAMEPGLGLLLALAVFRWRNARTIDGVLVIGAAALVYTGVRYGPESVLPAVKAAIVAGAMGQAVWAAYDLLWRAMRKNRLTLHQAREWARGTMGNRVVVAAYCAFAMPLAPVWALPVLALGLAVTNSYLGCFAALVGLVIAHPEWTPGLVPAALLAVPGLTYWRGNPIDSWTGRAQTWRLALATLWHADWRTRLTGFGHGGFPRAAAWWSGRRWTQQHYRQAHNDLIHVAFESGAVGVVAVLLWFASASRAFALGDPLTGALAAMLVNSIGQFPLYLPQTALPTVCVVALMARGLG